MGGAAHFALQRRAGRPRWQGRLRQLAGDTGGAGMTARSRGVGARSEASAWGRRLVAVPVGLALLAVALLGGVASVAIQEGNGTVQSDAQARVQSNRDAAVRALVRETNDFKRAVANWSG